MADIPLELERREKRLEVIAEAKAEISRRAQERFEREQAEYERKRGEREAKAKETGRKPGGKPPTAPTPGPRPKDQVNLTDDESRIMPSAAGFDQNFNAQAAVDIATHLIVEEHVTQNANDKQEVTPALDKLGALPAELGQVETLLADAGYYSEANLHSCADAAIASLIPDRRQPHNPTLAERMAADPAPPENPTPVEANKHRLNTKAGKARYAKRKSTVEPVFGIIKHVLGFRQFLLRGLRAVQGEWTLVCIAWNLKRLFVLKG